MSGDMVLATLKEKEEKTQTRRTRGLEKINSCPDDWELVAVFQDGIARFYNHVTGKELTIKCPYGGYGDRLWVKETFNYVPGDGEPNDFGIHYRADNTILWWRDNCNILDYPVYTKQRPSIFMPRKYSRILLEITEIRVQRIQDISEPDAQAEGTKYFGDIDYSRGITYRKRYSELWDKINAKRGHEWANNDWVWVIEFKRVEAK